MKLKDYVKMTPTQLSNPCKTCRLPKEILAEVSAGIDAGIDCQAICRWLQTKGFIISRSAIRGHRSAHHKTRSR